MENVRGGKGPANRFTAARPTTRASSTGSAIAATKNTRRTTLFTAEIWSPARRRGLWDVGPTRNRDHWYIHRAQYIAQEGPVKILFFDDFKLGVLKGDAVVDVSDTVRDIPHTGPHNLISGLIERFAEYKRRLEDVASRGKGVPLGQVKVRPPLPRPANMECRAGTNRKAGPRSAPAPINASHKPPSAIIAPEDPMVLPAAPATIFEGEAEVAVVIGKRASNVRAADAMSYV